MTYTITVSNGGPNQATGVIVTDMLPAGVTFVSGSGPGGPCSENCGTVTCPVGTLTGSTTVTITATPQPSLIVPPATSATVRNLAGAAGKEFDSSLINNSRYIDTTVYTAPAPTIINISPTVGTTAGGTPVVINGSNFVSGATVKLGGVAATITSLIATQIQATTGPHAYGPVNVVVTNPDGQAATLTNGFTYQAPAPTVSSITPTSGPASGGQSVTVTGTNFLAGATLSLGGVAATGVVVVSSTSITGTTGAHAAGVVNVVVTNPDGQIATKANGYTYNPPPAIASISPTSGSIGGGTFVTITGTNFVAGATLKLGGVSATGVTVSGSTTITGTTGAHAAGAVNVVVTNPDGQNGTLVNGFTYGSGPTISSISPTSGPATGGTTVTVTGSNFVSGATLALGGVAATGVTWLSSTQIRGTTGAHAVGAVNVVVTNPDTQSATLVNGYTYLGPAPTVASASPNTGPAAGGTLVTVTGSNFVSGATFTLGGVPATGVTWLSSTQIRGTTGVHAAGPVNVLVTNPDGQTGTLVNGYTYGTDPVVFSIGPTSGPTAGGTAVTVTGINFVSGATLTLGGVAATGVSVVGSTSITGTTGAHAAGAVNVVVTNPGGLSGTLVNGFTYGSAPTISSISPNTGPAAGGTVVTVTGTNFVSGATLKLGGVSATGVTWLSSTQIRGTTGIHAAGAVNVVVTNPDTLSATLVNGYTYGSDPAVISINPTGGSTVGGTFVTVTGVNFVSGATLTLGGVAATGVNVYNSTTIYATTGAHAPGAVNVVVTNTDGRSGTLVNGYTYGPPTVTGVNPASGSSVGGTFVTVTGTNFSAGATLTLGGVAATGVNVYNSTTIYANTGAHAPGVVNVVVTNTDGRSGTLVNGYTYGPPTVTGVSPASGSSAGGTFVTVTGTNFSAGATLTLGGVAATGVNVYNSTTIYATTGAHAPGAVNVVVTNTDGRSGTLVNGYTYGPPTVTGINPASGSSAGGTFITVTGTNFSAGATLTLGGVAATGVNVYNSTTIYATTRAHAPGVVNVVVTNTDGQSGTLVSGYTYSPPTVTGVNPASGSSVGGTFIAVTGTNFSAGATLTLGGVAATGVNVYNSTTIYANTGAHAPGVVNVVVTNTDGQSGTLVSGYTYGPPTVTGVNPASGSSVGGTFIAVTGTNFSTGATLTLGGVAATGVNVYNSTTIYANTGAHAPGVVNVVVTNTDGRSGTLVNGYTYGPPTVTGVNPASGSSAGGTFIAVTGTNFSTGATLTLGGVAATGVNVYNSTTIYANTGAHAPGVVNVVVTNTDGRSGTLVNGYTYTAPPTITSVTPTSGPTAGGTVTTINGTGFISVPTVTFGGVGATSVTFVSSTQITAKAGAHAAGVVNVVVRNPDSQSATLTNGFTYVTDTTPPSAPGSFRATAVMGSPITATLSWLSATDNFFVDHYDIQKSFNGGAYAAVATVPGAATSYTDSSGTLSAGVAYVYQIRAVDSSGNASAWVRDIATTIAWANEPIQIGVTTVRAQHIIDLRNAIVDSRRSANVLPNTPPWSDPDPVPGQTIGYRPFLELQTFLNPALDALGIPRPAYSSPAPAAGNPIRAAHIQEVRDALK